MKQTFAVLAGLFLFSAGTIPGRAADHTIGTGANQFSVDFAEIGNAGNPNDVGGSPFLAGKVNYIYHIGKYEISEEMIDKANAEGGLGLTKDTRGAEKPATGLSWYEAAKFVNWLNTSRGFQAPYNFDVGGNFQLWSAAEAWQMDGQNLYRHKDAKYFLPDVDEWYKAAYFDPNTTSYFDYPTGSNTAPTPVASGTAAGTAIYNGQVGPADITQAGGLSPYGTMGQGGNAYEWGETALDLVNNTTWELRVLRGCSWEDSSTYMQSSFLGGEVPAGDDDIYGIRIATVVPPPTPIEAWRAQYFSAVDLADLAKEATVWGDGADPDRDGHFNWHEYVFGGVPTISDPAATLPQGQTAIEGEDTVFYIAFNRRTNDPTLIYSPKISLTMEKWFGGAEYVLETGVTSINSEFERVTCKDLGVFAGSGRSFGRVEVTEIAP